jgi:hypothetical protein
MIANCARTHMDFAETGEAGIGRSLRKPQV